MSSLAPTFESLFEHWPGVVFRQRLDLSFDYASPRIAEWTGVPVAEWKRESQWLWQVLHEADIEAWRQQLEAVRAAPTGLTSSIRLRHAKTGRVTYVTEFRRVVRDAAGRATGYEGFWHDVTRQTISERRLGAAAWKETLAVLTMGLAHDFNNVMSGILSLSEFFLSQIDGAHPFHEGLALIKSNASQAAQLVHRIVHLHHGRIGDRNYHNLNEVVSDTADLLRQVVPRRLALRLELAPEPLAIYADAVELRQLIINMALNAVDATPSYGHLTFTTSLHKKPPNLGHFHGVAPRLPVVCLAVADTGAGVAPQHLWSIFEPFFTTKARNKGCGLGLYNARVFVEKHQGAISVESVEGRGTTFRVWLPQSDFTEAVKAWERASQRRRSLLLVGKNKTATESMTEFLRQHGYHVVAASGNARELLQSSEFQFDGLMLMVEGNDPEVLSLAASARSYQPPLKLILQIVGCNQDELDTQHLLKADLIVSEELPETIVLKRLADVFESTNGGPQ